MQQFSRPTEIEKTLASWMTDHLQKIIEASKRGAGEATGCNQEKLWQKFHKFVSSKECKVKWEYFLQQAELNTNPLLYQHVADKVFANLLKREYRENYIEDCVDQSTENSTRLTYEEENVVRYVGGYVLQALKKITCSQDISNMLDAMIKKTLLLECSPSNSQTWSVLHQILKHGLTLLIEVA